MPILAISIDGESPSMRTVQQRTARLIPGVLCEVWADERLQLCLVERVDRDLVSVRRLPGQKA